MRLGRFGRRRLSRLLLRLYVLRLGGVFLLQLLRLLHVALLDGLFLRLAGVGFG